MKDSMQRQQEMVNQLLMTLTLNQRPAHTQSQFISSAPRDTDIKERFSAAIGNAVKFLCTHISYFGGTEDDSVDLWIEKVESVADLHNLSPATKLAAATTKLTKIARKWFEISLDTINSSWLAFKKEIINRFRRKVFFDEVIQKVNDKTMEFFQGGFSRIRYGQVSAKSQS